MIPDDRDFMAQAACRGMPGDLFFPERGGNRAVAAAKAVCAVCPVKGPCLDYALDHNEKMGIWAGTSEKERRAIRRQRQLAA